MDNVAERSLFKNRQDAGKELGFLLKDEYQNQNAIVLGIPRGGVEVAYYVAQTLNTAFSFIVSIKLPVPNNKENAFGAIAEDYTVYVPAEAEEILDDEIVNEIIDQQKLEVDRSASKFRQGRSFPNLKDRIVILVDEGIVTGLTLVSAIRLCRKKRASKIVVAAPVSGKAFDKGLGEADDLKIIVQHEGFFAVGQAYEQFEDLEDQKVMEIIKKVEEG